MVEKQESWKKKKTMLRDRLAKTDKTGIKHCGNKGILQKDTDEVIKS